MPRATTSPPFNCIRHCRARFVTPRHVRSAQIEDLILPIGPIRIRNHPSSHLPVTDILAREPLLSAARQLPKTSRSNHLSYFPTFSLLCSRELLLVDKSFLSPFSFAFRNFRKFAKTGVNVAANLRRNLSRDNCVSNRVFVHYQ